MIRPFSFILISDKSLLEAVSNVRRTRLRCMMATRWFLIIISETLPARFLLLVIIFNVIRLTMAGLPTIPTLRKHGAARATSCSSFAFSFPYWQRQSADQQATNTLQRVWGGLQLLSRCCLDRCYCTSSGPSRLQRQYCWQRVEDDSGDWTDVHADLLAFLGRQLWLLGITRTHGCRLNIYGNRARYVRQCAGHDDLRD